jgi:WD repeat-containing protein 35
VDTCVELQQWSQAVSLAEQHQVEDIEGLLAQYAEYLLNKGDLSRAVELYKKAGRTLEAIKIMINVRSYVFRFFANFLNLCSFIFSWPKKLRR